MQAESTAPVNFFSREMGLDFFDELCSEHLEVVIPRGAGIVTWSYLSAGPMTSAWAVQ